MTNSKKQKKEINDYSEFEAKQNLLGFFELLLKIDMRNNPEKYKNKNQNSSSKEND